MEKHQGSALIELSRRLRDRSARLNAARVHTEPEPSSRIPVLGPLLSRLYRLANRLATRWYVAPQVEQQARFSAEITAAFDDLARLAFQQERELNLVEEQCFRLMVQQPEGLSAPEDEPSASNDSGLFFGLTEEKLLAWENADLPAGLDSHHENSLAERYPEEQVIRDPFSWSQNIGWHYMFNLALLGPALRCRTGDLVLDFAGASGWVSEFLNRFGFNAVLFDYAEPTLRFSRQRFASDRRLAGQSVWMQPVRGDGMRLPFADEALDGIVCMNALHHMPSYQAVLREMARVLKPGCRAVFGEPPEKHAQSAPSLLAMHEHGIFEKNMPLDLIHVYAKRAGFAKMWRYPYVYPESFEFDYPDAGREPGPILKRLWKHLLDPLVVPGLFALQKPGERPLDSNAALFELEEHRLHAEIALLNYAETVPAGSMFVDRVRVKNIGDVIWLAAQRPMGGFVRLGVKLCSLGGQLLDQGMEDPFFPRDIAPGETVELDMRVRAPTVPGKYLLKYDLVDEGRFWFESRGSIPVGRTLVVA